MTVNIKLSASQLKTLGEPEQVVVTGKSNGNTIYIGINSTTIKLLVSDTIYGELGVGNKLNIKDGYLTNEKPKVEMTDKVVKSNPPLSQFSHRFPK